MEESAVVRPLWSDVKKPRAVVVLSSHIKKQTDCTIEDDLNLTDKKFPGNPTRSYRTRQPPIVVGDVLEWEGHSPEELQKMRDHLDKLKRLGIEAINY